MDQIRKAEILEVSRACKAILTLCCFVFPDRLSLVLQVEGPAVLQVLKLRNISAPKDNEESQAAPKLWKITLTDGHANVVAICLEPLRNLRLVCDFLFT